MGRAEQTERAIAGQAFRIVATLQTRTRIRRASGLCHYPQPTVPMAISPTPPSDSEFSRRDFLKVSAGATLAGSLAAEAPADAAEKSHRIIPEENAPPGSYAGQLTRVRL